MDAVILPGDHLVAEVSRLHAEQKRLGTIVAYEGAGTIVLRYFFYDVAAPDWVQLVVEVDPAQRCAPSLTGVTIAADWQEREIEDLFGIRFSGHPRLGDFVLHDDKWAEDLGLMRPQVPDEAIAQTRRHWAPLRVLQEDGAFVMPVGPIYSGDAESSLFLLETVGEDVVRAVPRLFYKFRAIERLAQGRSMQDVLLLAERCNGTAAFGNGWAYCRAVESALGVRVPPEATAWRTFLAELERVRHHVGAIRAICDSTALGVAAAQAAAYEERLLRVSEGLTGHRYLFGALCIGGISFTPERLDAERAYEMVRALVDELQPFRALLERTSSFLDRIEAVGVIDTAQAQAFELVGPIARASGVGIDMRVAQPYGVYDTLTIDVPVEEEGDGFARLRVLFREICASVDLMAQSLRLLRGGAVQTQVQPRDGAALGWTETPQGASLCWVALSPAGQVTRFRISPPSFCNWHGFHIATEDFAFQDLPIILATMGLSVAENDR
jgi:formate hydrogenlyase subunit 5